MLGFLPSLTPTAFLRVRIIIAIYRPTNGLREVKRHIKISQHILGFASIWTQLSAAECGKMSLGLACCLSSSARSDLQPNTIEWGTHIPKMSPTDLMVTLFTWLVSEHGTPTMPRFTQLRKHPTPVLWPD